MGDLFGGVVGGVVDLVGGPLLQLVLPALATILSTMAIALLKKQLSRLNIKLDREQEDALRAAIRQVIVRIEEEARTAPADAGTKLDRAVMAIQDRTNLTHGEAVALVHEELAVVRKAITPVVVVATTKPVAPVAPGVAAAPVNDPLAQHRVNAGLPGGGRR